MFTNNERMVLVDLKLQETGTFGQQWARPYAADIHHDTLENLSKRIEQTVMNSPNTTIGSNLISGMSGGLITLASTPERSVAIPNGWDQRRFRFTLTVEVPNGFGGCELYYFQGYSEFFDLSYSDNIDPNMVFFINSYTRVSRTQDPNNPVGGFNDRVIESRQVLNGRYGLNQVEQNLFGARPEDLFIGLQSSYVSSNAHNYLEQPVIDTRINLQNKTFSNSRTNAVPSLMLGKVINGYRQAQTLADYGQGAENIYDRAIQSVYERSPTENIFIRTLTMTKGLPEAATTFTLNDLARIDPTINTRTYYTPVENQAMLSQANMFSDWNGTNIETQLAALVANSTSSLMQDCGLITCYFTSTNMTMNSQPDTRMTAAGLTVSTANPVGSYNLFISRFNTEIMPDITRGGIIPVAVNVGCDIFNETRIEISVNGQPSIPYVFPSFCDALLQPTISANRDNYNGLVHGLETILNYTGISDTMPAHDNLIMQV